MTHEKILDLIHQAQAQLAFSYAPYSGFLVGAALLAKDGKVFTGWDAILKMRPLRRETVPNARPFLRLSVKVCTTSRQSALLAVQAGNYPLIRRPAVSAGRS